MTDLSAVVRFGLLLIRPGVLIAATPFLGAGYAPTTTRLGLTLIVAFVLAPLVPAPTGLGAGALGFVVLREVLIGAALSIGIRTLVNGADLAGQLLGYQIGLSYGSIVDPQSGVRNGVFATLYSSLAIIIALGTNLHQTVLRAVAASFTALPIGFGGVDGSLVTVMARTLGLVLVLGVRIAAPVVVVLLLTEMLLGLVSRVAPSLNILVLGAPARVVVGLLVLAATLVTVPPLLERYTPLAFDLAAAAARALR